MWSPTRVNNTNLDQVKQVYRNSAQIFIHSSGFIAAIIPIVYQYSLIKEENKDNKKKRIEEKRRKKNQYSTVI